MEDYDDTLQDELDFDLDDELEQEELDKQSEFDDDLDDEFDDEFDDDLDDGMDDFYRTDEWEQQLHEETVRQLEQESEGTFRWPKPSEVVFGYLIVDQLLNAVKAYREETGCTLKQAKTYIDKMKPQVDAMNLTRKEELPAAPQSSSGAAGLIAVLLLVLLAYLIVHCS